MPDRPGVDDNDSLKRLIGLWRDGEADLAARQNQIWRSIVRELGKSDPNQIRVDRLKLAAGRLDELAGVASAIADDLADETKTWIEKNGLVDIYGAGVLRVAPFSYTIPHRAAVEVLADDLYDDVLKLTQYVDDGAKSWVRRVGRELTGFKLTGGQAVKAQARRFESELRHEFVGRGITAVTYRDGSRHGFGEYAEMLLRTKTAVAYNVGTLNQTRGLGIQFVEILDGALCGLTAHEDTQLANGMIVPVEIAAAFPIAHPQCRRSLNPRPDVTPENLSQAGSVQSDEARADQKAWEAYLRAQQKASSGPRSRLTGPKARTGGGGGQKATSRPRGPLTGPKAKTGPKGAGLTGKTPTGPVAGPRKALTGAKAPVPAGPPKLGHIDAGQKGVDYSKALPTRNEFHDVLSGPRAHTIQGTPGKGVALVDDRGRLFYWEHGGGSTRDDAVAGLQRIMDENRRSLPKGVDGARAHIVVQSASAGDAELSRRYGKPFRTAANANAERVVYFQGEAARTSIWHENGHVTARAINDRIGDRLRDPRFTMDALDALDGPAAVMERMGEAASISRLGGTGALPGEAWLNAMELDRARLGAVTGGEGRPAYQTLFPDFDGSALREPGVNWETLPDGYGLGADGQLRAGVTDYGATNAAEDFAESWRMVIQDRAGFGVGSYRKPDGFLTIAHFDDVFSDRAAVLREIMDGAGLEFED